ncbi:2'-5' RNA ligase family protein [Aquamicrobium sp. LC103]|uniref:2'-5' RNA ligase family protein n=1 Tax=Aquamicrobium sp. LC103 TaxID=1120658 RepID=UPI00069C8998|nr:2'-5' RNA ligase family protein [Aquamicrobium sp. LC103]TKT81087.1 2'-5' RNA ligase [Aquamicrobium sp. LC103]
MQGVFEFCRDPLPRRPRRPERLIFLLFPKACARASVVRLASDFVCDNQLTGSLLREERLHVSLQHVGDYPHLRTKFVYAATQAGKAIAMPPFEAVFRSIGSFEGAPSTGAPRRRPLVLLCEGEGLFELHRKLGVAMERNGLRAVAHFRPHMTLFYGFKTVPMQPIEPITVVFDRFFLIHSEVGLGIYNEVEEWPLAV